MFIPVTMTLSFPPSLGNDLCHWDCVKLKYINVKICHNCDKVPLTVTKSLSVAAPVSFFSSWQYGSQWQWQCPFIFLWQWSLWPCLARTCLTVQCPFLFQWVRSSPDRDRDHAPVHDHFIEISWSHIRFWSAKVVLLAGEEEPKVHY